MRTPLTWAIAAFVMSQVVPSGVPHNVRQFIFRLPSENIVHINDFTPNPGVTTAQAGDWHTSSTWTCTTGSMCTAGIPNATAYVQIDHAVTSNTDTAIVFTTLFVDADGSLAINRSGTSTVKTITVSDVDPGDAPEYETGIIVKGTVTLTGKTKGTEWTRMTEEMTASDSSVVVEACEDWVAGDRILLPDTREFTDSVEQTGPGGRPPFAPEVLTINTVSGGAPCTVTFTGSTAIEHVGARSGTNTLERYAPIGNLSRNIVLRSEDPAGFRGHLIASGTGVLNLSYVRIEDFGRTSNACLDVNVGQPNCNDEGGLGSAPATNHIGRYPLHLHGPHKPSSIVGVVLERSLKWPITIHDTDTHTIQWNVIYDGYGWGIGTEMSTEANNLIEDNLVVGIKGTSNRGDERLGFAFPENGVNGSCFWFESTRDIVRRNVGVNCRAYAFTYWSAFNEAINVFDNNEGINSQHAFSPWFVGVATTPSTINGFYEWHSFLQGSYIYGVQNLTINNYWSRGEYDQLGANNFTQGFWWGDYDSIDITMNDLNIANKLAAAVGPAGHANPATLDNDVLRDVTFNNPVFTRNRLDVTAEKRNLSTPASIVPPMRLTVVNPTHTATVVFEYQKVAAAGGSNSNLVKSYDLLVYTYEGNSSDNFEVYAATQDPAAAMDVSTGDYVACPSAGLTVQQCFNAHGVAPWGKVMPGTVTTRSGVDGFVNSISPPAPAPLARERGPLLRFVAWMF